MMGKFQMTDVQLDYVFRMQDALGVPFGPEYEMVLTAEYDGEEFELTQIDIESDDIVLTHRDVKRGMSTEQRVIWDRAQDDLWNDDDLRPKAWRTYDEQRNAA